MSKQTDNSLPSLIEQAFIVRCRICKRAVSRSLYPLSGDRQVAAEYGKPLLPRQRFVLTHRATVLAQKLHLGHGVLVHCEDVFDTTCDEGSYGCCGYSPGDVLNLRCAKGHGVGTFNDDCHVPHFAYFALDLSELYPLPKEDWPALEPNTSIRR